MNMKNALNLNNLFLGLFVTVTTVIQAQKQTFDIASYSLPKGWEKETTASSLLVSKEEPEKDIFCFMQLYKAIPGTADSKANFDNAWESIVKKAVTIASPPEMQPVTTDNGWEIQSGYALFEGDDTKGVAMLITSSSNGKMVNLVILTNTNSYEKDITTFLESITLKIVPQANEGAGASSSKPAAANTIVRKEAYAFTTTNWDDGWVSTVQEEWVEVKKGSIKVLLHYPEKKADAYNSMLKDGDYTAWNILVAPRYSNMKNFEWKSIQSWESVSFIRADATEIATGKTVHIVLFKKHYSKGNGRYIEFITDSKTTYENEFGPYHNTEFDWDKTANMQFRNKFAVAPNDLLGKWSTTDYASISYYYVNTGGTAGTTATSTADDFTFLPGNNYQSNHYGASGMVGNMKFSSQSYKGKSIVENWTIRLTNRFQGAEEKFDSYFEAVKGGRALILKDKYGTIYSLVKQ